ncbi:HNH endonuclease [Shouchella clausii]|uniref:HNH endonuclease n=1 Tax=Shouchella clausii TaxID=79880 RepID=UPI000BA657C5|nr:HNH endonuclease [Shouchella clausii]PAD91652.1 hypothetical protein CHH52_13600 [Shouchella clausii]
MVDEEDYKYLSQFNWKLSNRGYAARNINRKGEQSTILMHRLIMDNPKGMVVEHKDRNPLNNQKSNLRICTQADNTRNVALSKTNTSGYKGVTWHKRRNKWQVNIRYDGKMRYLGLYDNKHIAARVYNLWAKDIFGDFAWLNKIEE